MCNFTWFSFSWVWLGSDTNFFDELMSWIQIWDLLVWLLWTQLVICTEFVVLPKTSFCSVWNTRSLELTANLQFAECLRISLRFARSFAQHFCSALNQWIFGVEISLCSEPNHPRKLGGDLQVHCPSPCDWSVGIHIAYLSSTVFARVIVAALWMCSGHFSSVLGSAPYLYQQRFLKHLSGEFDAMTNVLQVALLVASCVLVTKPVTITMWEMLLICGWLI